MEVMLFLRFLPAALGLWVLGAHFLRGGHLLLFLFLLAAPAALFVRSPVSRRVVQAALAAGVLVWLSSAARIGAARRAEGRPWARMAVILLTVAAVSGGGAALLQGRAGDDWFRSTPRPE